MTLVVALKVGDGLVLGADSASTLELQGSSGPEFVNSYFNAEKLFNLVKALPIGVLVYGLGGLANRSVGSLLKDLWLRLCDRADKNWYLDPSTYTIEEAAERLKVFFYDDLYWKQFKPIPGSGLPAMGFLVGGYSIGAGSSEVWQVTVNDDGTCAGPQELLKQSDPYGIRWEGQPEACIRLVRGYNAEAVNRLVQAGVDAQTAVNVLDHGVPFALPTMPIQDAIDLVEFLEEVTCGFSRFAPGHPTVARPIDIAAITPHEGFRWVKRKHYFEMKLNPDSNERRRA